jgi:murein DD-endopeptidase MepM/ murein hydrolase activator NlpD
MLTELGLEPLDRQSVIDHASEVFDLLTLRAGKQYAVLARDTLQGADYLIYEPSVYEYIVFNLKGDHEVQKVKREIVTETRTAAGTIETSLWQAMVDNGYSFELTAKMEDALQWSIDFHHLQPADEFRLVFEQDLIEGQPVAVRAVQAASYRTADTIFYSFHFESPEGPQAEETGYYDEEGRPMNAGFLKAPVKYSRISSYYNPNRLHPVLKYRRPHYGTDYAAPYGTPIMAVANGVVTHASYTSGNGNYVKIKHNDTYTTQYLHMQGFANGIRPGAFVRQGQTIGYVGSTGLATGPHVCFRFWKNGRQVNHLRLSFPPAKPLAEELMPGFIKLRDEYLALLKGIELPASPRISQAETSTNP